MFVYNKGVAHKYNLTPSYTLNFYHLCRQYIYNMNIYIQQFTKSDECAYIQHIGKNCTHIYTQKLNLCRCIYVLIISSSINYIMDNFWPFISFLSNVTNWDKILLIVDSDVKSICSCHVFNLDLFFVEGNYNKKDEPNMETNIRIFSV